jgi:hypothetical protein
LFCRIETSHIVRIEVISRVESCLASAGNSFQT